MSADAFSPVVFPRFRDEDAEHSRERAQVRGYAAGHAEGYRAGLAQAAAEAAAAESLRAVAEDTARRDAASAIAALHSAAAVLTARARELTAASERDVTARAIELAELIVSGALADPERSGVTALRRALSAHDPLDDVRAIRLHPDDVRSLTVLGALPEDVAVSADDSLRPGDALIELEDGFVDARISAAMERARRTVAQDTR